MNKKVIIISVTVVFMIIAVISTFFVVKYFMNKNKIDYVYEEYSSENIQKRLDTENNNETASTGNLMLQIDGENVLGVIKIDKINFEGLIYESTSIQTLAKGVGHFTNTPYLDGNVCLAAHNTNSYWAKLHTLSNGDKIQYTCFLGTKEYEVSNVSKISETDWDSLKNTDTTNILTLITCVKGQKNLRLCVQAKEIK